MQIQRPDKIAALAVVSLVISAQHLKAAADGQEGDPVLNGGDNLPVLAPVQILQQHLLLKVLPAADKNQVKACKAGPGADGQFGDAGVYTPPLQALGQADHVAPVAV